jgi:hypothetical protein
LNLHLSPVNPSATPTPRATTIKQKRGGGNFSCHSLTYLAVRMTREMSWDLKGHINFVS